MRLSRLVLPIAALLVTACAVDDGPTVNSRPDLAGVRFINGLADEGLVNVYMVDQAQWSSYAVGIDFRQSGFTLPTEAGTRPVRVFRASNVLDSIVVLIEQDVNIVGGQNVTLLLTGSVQDGTARIEMIPDAVPDSTAGQIHIRAVNAMSGAANVSWVDAGGASAPVTVPALGATDYQARPTGAVTASFASAAAPDKEAPEGEPEIEGIGATAGYSTSGSALSAFLFPPSVVGSLAPQGGDYAQAGVVWFVDRVPAPPR